MRFHHASLASGLPSSCGAWPTMTPSLEPSRTSWMTANSSLGETACHWRTLARLPRRSHS
eukprot:6484926-Heterocapsa_arctica.AAC.1